MKIINKFLILGFHLANLILIGLYLYPGSILGCFIYDDCSTQPHITKDFLISSNHFYMFTVLSILGILAYHNSKNIKFLTIYLLLLSITLEILHIFIQERGFEWSDLFGNIIGVVFILIIYKFNKKYV